VFVSIKSVITILESGRTEEDVIAKEDYDVSLKKLSGLHISLMQAIFSLIRMCSFQICLAQRPL